MKTLKLNKLTLSNFKGIKSFSLDLKSGDAKVYGDNATGKTTIFDAFTWLLFDKDSQNKKDFSIKTIGASGVDHAVEASLSVDGTPITLKKVYAEKWTKKRGAATYDFTRHTTDYFIDGVPAKKKEYNHTIAEIVDEDVFKLLTNPSYFNEQLHWQDRRKTLLEVAGDITDTDVIQSNPGLSKLPGILNGRKIEDHRKVIAARRSEINKELDRIPVRIDEVTLSIPDLKGMDEKSIKNEIEGLNIMIDSKEAELSRIQNGTEVSVKEKQLREIEGQLIEIKNQFQSCVHEQINEERQRFYEIKQKCSDIEYDIRQKKDQVNRNESLMERKSGEAARLRDEWKINNDTTFSWEGHRETCPACGQDLPSEQIENARANAEAEFNRNKSDVLTKINDDGKRLVAEANQLKSENEFLNQTIKSLEEALQVEREKLQKVENEIQDIQAGVKDVKKDPAYQTKLQEAEAIKSEIYQLQASVQEKAQKVREEVSKLKETRTVLERDLNKFSQVEQANKRVESLKEQERAHAAEFEKLENELYLTEEFIRTKVNLLEGKINSKFKFARFKLFDQQINGGLQETCETLYKEVPYSSGLNNAARINVGLDIIQTLNDHYGFSAPIFVDNAEAVTQLIEVNAQVISLVVSANDQELRVETTKLQEAI